MGILTKKTTERDALHLTRRPLHHWNMTSKYLRSRTEMREGRSTRETSLYLITYIPEYLYLFWMDNPLNLFYSFGHFRLFRFLPRQKSYFFVNQIPKKKSQKKIPHWVKRKRLFIRDD